MFRQKLIYCFAPFLFFGGILWGQSLDDLIQKNIQARGGLDKLKAVQSVKMRGSMTMQGMEVPFELTLKRPRMVRMNLDIQGQAVVQAFDGRTAWWIMPFMGATEPQRMPDEAAKDVKEMGDLDGPLVDYREKGHRLELVGEEELEGTPVYKLKLTKPSGDVSYFSLDKESGIELKVEATRTFQGREFQVETYLSDYQPVQEVLFPFTIEVRSPGNPMFNQILRIDTVEVNVEVSDDIFKMPEKP